MSLRCSVFESVQKFIAFRSLETQVVTDLLPGRQYCVSVQFSDSLENKISNFSQPVCVSTPARFSAGTGPLWRESRTLRNPDVCQTNPTCPPCRSIHLNHFNLTGAAGAGGAGPAGLDRFPLPEEAAVATDPGESNLQTHKPAGSADRS